MTAHDPTTPGTDPLDGLVALAYEAGAGARPWADVCAALMDVFGLWSVQILGVFKANGSPMFSFGRGGPPAAGWLQYITTYHAINPRIPLATPIPLGEWFHDHEHFDDTFVATHPFFRDYLVPWGGRHMSATKLIDTDEFVVFVGLHRSVDMQPMSAAEIARFERLRSHLSRALALFVAVQRDHPRMLADHALLDPLDQAVLAVHSTRLIGYRNPAADRLLRSGGALCERDGFLDAQEIDGSRALASALFELELDLDGSAPSPAASPSASPPHAAPEAPRRVVRLAPVGGQPGQIVVLLPVHPDPSLHAFGDHPCAVAVARPLGGEVCLDPLLICTAYDLTPAEALVAIGVAQGHTPERIASDRRVSIATVRTQLRQVYEKLGVIRQSELVRMLVQMPRFASEVRPG